MVVVLIFILFGLIGRLEGAGLDPPALHVGDELIGDLRQYVLGQPGHAQDMVASAVHVVSERDKLRVEEGEGEG